MSFLDKLSSWFDNPKTSTIFERYLKTRNEYTVLRNMLDNKKKRDPYLKASSIEKEEKACTDRSRNI